MQEIREYPPPPSSEKSKQLVDSPSEYAPQDQPETPIDPGENLEKPLSKGPQKVPIADPFSRFWPRETADASDKDKKRHRWLTRKPKRRHSVERDILEKQDKRSYKYVLEGERTYCLNHNFTVGAQMQAVFHLNMQNLF